jgi:hypothetical protein
MPTSMPAKIKGEKNEDFIKREIKFNREVEEYIHEVGNERVEFTDRSRVVMQQRVELFATQ